MIKTWFIISSLLILLSIIISVELIPDNIIYKDDRSCDISNEPASYVLYDNDGEIIGEFCLLHAIGYNIASSGSMRPITGPIEIEFLSFGLSIMIAGVLAFSERVDSFFNKVWNKLGLLTIFLLFYIFNVILAKISVILMKIH